MAGPAAFVISISTSAARDETPEAVLAAHYREGAWWSHRKPDVESLVDKPCYVKFVSVQGSQIIGRARFIGTIPTKTGHAERPWRHEVEFDSPDPVLGLYARDFVRQVRNPFFGLTPGLHRRLDQAVRSHGR
jgi:hypothetical protein